MHGGCTANLVDMSVAILLLYLFLLTPSINPYGITISRIDITDRE